MFGHNAILYAKNVCRNPVHRRKPMPRKSDVDDHKIAVGHNRSVFILQRLREALDEIAEALPARRNMRCLLYTSTILAVVVTDAGVSNSSERHGFDK